MDTGARRAGQPPGEPGSHGLGSLLRQAANLGVPMRDRRLGVGKRMGTAVWLHGRYRHLLPADAVCRGERAVPNGFLWNVVKLDDATGNVSFIHYPDFDSADEPVTGDAWVCRPDGGCRLVRGLADPWILHHRWLAVADGYGGFDVPSAIRRSIAWKSAFGRDAGLSSRIGRRSVWIAECARRGLPA